MPSRSSTGMAFGSAMTRPATVFMVYTIGTGPAADHDIRHTIRVLSAGWEKCCVCVSPRTQDAAHRTQDLSHSRLRTQDSCIRNHEPLRLRQDDALLLPPRHQPD